MKFAKTRLRRDSFINFLSFVEAEWLCPRSLLPSAFSLPT
jgi:hypothetical protein